MEITNGKCLWAPEELLGSWIKCTRVQAEKLLKYFNLPVCTYESSEGLYNISKDLKSFQVAPLSDPKVRGYFGFNVIGFPEKKNPRQTNVDDIMGITVECTTKEALKLFDYLGIKYAPPADGFFVIEKERVQYFRNSPNPYISFSDIVFPETKKIIGYKCPVELFGGKIKPGKIFKYSHTDIYRAEASDEYNVYMLPKEIVEAWEPVYELVMKYAKNTALLTKDGRVVGNAIITDYLDGNYLITTDYGNKIKFSEKEVESQWYIGKVKNVSNHKYAVKAK